MKYAAGIIAMIGVIALGVIAIYLNNKLKECEKKTIGNV